MQAVCEETGLPADIMTIRWDKDLGEKCGETWASRATTLSCAAAQRAAQKLAADLKTTARSTTARRPRILRRVRLQLHDPARHAGVGPESDDAPDLQLRGAGGHPRR